MTLFILLILMVNALMFMFMMHPLSLGVILLIQTVFTALITGNMNFNFWFSYILFLIMIGGMLILFIYMTSIASNEKFNFSFSLMMTWMSLVSLSFITSVYLDLFPFTMKMFNYNMIMQPSIMMNSISMSKYMNNPSSLNIILIIVYLLITLIAVVKITETQYGPMRQKF